MISSGPRRRLQFQSGNAVATRLLDRATARRACTHVETYNCFMTRDVEPCLPVVNFCVCRHSVHPSTSFLLLLPARVVVIVDRRAAARFWRRDIIAARARAAAHRVDCGRARALALRERDQEVHQAKQSQSGDTGIKGSRGSESKLINKNVPTSQMKRIRWGGSLSPQALQCRVLRM